MATGLSGTEIPGSNRGNKIQQFFFRKLLREKDTKRKLKKNHEGFIQKPDKGHVAGSRESPV
jgi:hypothetical protein